MIRKLLLTSSIALLCGCATELVKPLNTNPLSINPIEKPVQNMTAFSEALSCMDTLIDKKIHRTILVTIDELPNESEAKGIKSSKTMLFTALSKMAANNQKIRIVTINI